jgi:hypothetical protein
MKIKKRITVLFVCFTILFSCDSYETTVINTVHADGSFTRVVVMHSDENDQFEPEEFKVPLDSTWKTEIGIEVDGENDTTWVLTAEKYFENVRELNSNYEADTGRNGNLNRQVSFVKKFRWFTTVFRFTESVKRTMEVDCPVNEFLTGEELDFFYLPHSIQKMAELGSDSLETKALLSSIEEKTEVWYTTCMVRRGLSAFSGMYLVHGQGELSREEIMSKEPEIISLMEEDLDQDSLFFSLFGEGFVREYKQFLDSAITIIEEEISLSLNASAYDVKTRMPGRIIATNGYPGFVEGDDPVSEVLWTVSGEYFLSENYDMWVESRVNNFYIWIISILFVLFAITGFILYYRKR